MYSTCIELETVALSTLRAAPATSIKQATRVSLPQGRQLLLLLSHPQHQRTGLLATQLLPRIRIEKKNSNKLRGMALLARFGRSWIDVDAAAPPGGRPRGKDRGVPVDRGHARALRRGGVEAKATPPPRRSPPSPFHPANLSSARQRISVNSRSLEARGPPLSFCDSSASPIKTRLSAGVSNERLTGVFFVRPIWYFIDNRIGPGKAGV